MPATPWTEITAQPDTSMELTLGTSSGTISADFIYDDFVLTQTETTAAVATPYTELTAPVTSGTELTVPSTSWTEIVV